MKNKFLKLLLLMIILSSNVLQAQQKDRPYIPLFDTNKVWYSVQAEEFGGWWVEKLFVDYNDNILNVNDTLYYKLNYLDTKGGYCCYREDTIAQKIYERSNPDYPETLIYDFSLLEGDSMYISAYSVPGVWLYLDSTKTVNVFGIERKIYYLKNFNWGCNVIWIEGIGSLAGLVHSASDPSWDSLNFQAAYLTCVYENNTNSIYQSEYGALWGCSFENCPYSIDENVKKSFSIFPNPITDQLTIHSDKFTIEKIEILDLTGKIVYSNSQFTNQLIIELTNCPSGIYFIKIQSENYTITQKIIQL